MFLSHVTNQCLVEVITSHFNRSADYGTAQGNNGDICRTTTNIYDHVAARLGNINTSADRSCYRLLDDRNLSCASLISRILNRLALYLGRTARDADADTRLMSTSLLVAIGAGIAVLTGIGAGLVFSVTV